jgi:hypothetical protein
MKNRAVDVKQRHRPLAVGAVENYVGFQQVFDALVRITAGADS